MGKRTAGTPNPKPNMHINMNIRRGFKIDINTDVKPHVFIVRAIDVKAK